MVIDRIVKASIRVMLVVASLNMVIGNWNANPNSKVASALFLLANLSALAWNDVRKK